MLLNKERALALMDKHGLDALVAAGLTPYQALRTGDGYMNLGGATQPNWERLCHAIAREELLTDPRFVDNAARMKNVKQLESELERTFGTRPTAHWLKVLEDAGIPAGPIYDMAQVWADEQVKAREMDVVMDHPKAGKVHNIGIAVKMARTPGRIRSAAPVLGQHTDEILELAGYSAGDIKALREEGAAGVTSGVTAAKTSKTAV